MPTITLSKKQAEYIRNAHHRWNFSIGAVRSGKSHIGIQYVIPHCLRKRRGMKGLNFIIGVTKETIERNVLTPIRSMWGEDAATQINTRNIAQVFGEECYCIGGGNADQVTRIRGSEIKFAYVDEIVDIHQEVFEMLKSRLSLPYSTCHATANPSYPNHFIKEFINTKEKGADIYYQQYSLYDNPFIPREYVRSLEIEYSGTVYFRRYVLGEWSKAEGLVYPMYEKAIGTAPDDIPTSEICVSIDYGTQNPFAAILWERKKLSTGDVWYGTRGYYYSGKETGKQKTDTEYVDDMEEFLAPEIDTYMNNRNSDNISSKIRLIIDPSAASFIEAIRRRPWCKIIRADNDVADGIRQTATAIQTEKIKIDPSIKEWVQEAGNYVWDSKKEDTVVKEKDHYMDGTRYFVRTMHVVKAKSEHTFLWN